MFFDYTRRRLPNAWLLLGLILLPLQWTAGMGTGVDDRLLGLALSLVLLGPGLFLGVLGGGDLKLGALAGALWGSAALLVGVLAAGLWAGLVLLVIGFGSGRRFPFAVAFLPGAILTWMLVV
ncbi:hypothetical protein LV476_01885 [Guyparkeria hydrothermalis]|uniref:prepilin peptidase n=1 Tax=Guyparkeria hydrothermalis TaxID=923 RepID=UPI0020223F74|nr:prepilin peptidase [Guyparkeria hydrothermalis]MCL7743702.1 hypothetical protein [Guyparkeria hydrothermalis]